MFVLDQLGEKLPSEISKETIIGEMREVHTMLGQYSETDLLALPNMTDNRKLVSKTAFFYFLHRIKAH